MKTLIRACRNKPLHQQNQEMSWTLACRLSRMVLSRAEQQSGFGQLQRIQQQARQQSGRL